MPTPPALSQAEWSLLRDLVEDGAICVSLGEATTDRLVRAGLARALPFTDDSIFVAPTGLGFRMLQAAWTGPRRRPRPALRGF
jgi:hypothetical protein